MLLSAKIGAIEFAGDEVRVAVVKTGGRTPVVLEVQSRTATYAEEEARFQAMVDAVGEAVDALKHPPVSFILSASARHSIVRSITIPMRGRKRVLAAAQFELEPHLAFPIEDLLLDFNLVAEVDGETEVLAVGVRRAHLEEQRAILEEAGVEVEAVNLDAIALTGLWQATQKGRSKGFQAVLHVRDTGCSLVVLFNGNLAYFRNLPVKGDAVVSEPTRVALEVQNTLRAFLSKWRGGGEIDGLDVTGIELSPAEADDLSTALRLPVDSGIILRGIKGGATAVNASGGVEGPNRWEAAIGTAFAGAGGGHAMNFDESGATQASVARAVAPQLVYASAMALVALLLWGACYYIGTGFYRGQIETLQADIDRINGEIADLEEEGLGQDVNVDFFRDPPMLEVLDEIARRMPESKVLITRLSVSPPGARGGWVTISGSTTNADHVGEVIAELSKSTLFTVDQNINQQAENNRVTFTVRVRRISEESEDGNE